MKHTTSPNEPDDSFTLVFHSHEFSPADVLAIRKGAGVEDGIPLMSIRVTAVQLPVDTDTHGDYE